MTVKEDEAVDTLILFAVEGSTRGNLEDPTSGCNASGMNEVADASSGATFAISEMEGMPACEIRVPGQSLSETEEFFDKEVTLTHSDGAYEVVVKEGFFGKVDNPRLTLEFPGDVKSASGSNTINGTSVTWDSPHTEGEITASGADSGSQGDDAATGAAAQDSSEKSSGIPWLLILLGVVGALVITGGILAAVLLRRRRAGVAGQAPQPGYVAPGVPGVAPAAGQAQAGLPPQPGDVAGPQGAVTNVPAQPGGAGQVPPAGSYVPVQGQVPPQAAPYSPGQGGLAGQAQAPSGPQPPVPPGQGHPQGGYPPQGPLQ